MLFAETSPLWSGFFALAGAIVGGSISFAVAVYVNRLSIISKQKNEWVGAFRAEFIRYITQVRAAFVEAEHGPWGRLGPVNPEADAEEEKFKAKLAESLSKLYLYLSPDANDIHGEFFKTLSEMESMAFDIHRPGGGEAYGMLSEKAHALARRIINDELKNLERAMRPPWSDW